MWQDQVVAMAVVAGGCHDKASLEQASPMDALGVVLHHIVLGDIVNTGHHFAFPVALSTQEGNVHFVGAGVGIRVMFDIMMSMAFFAAGCIGIVLQKGLAMNAPGIVGHGPLMAETAIHGIQVIGMRKSLVGCIHMAGDAAVAMMDRPFKDHGIHEHGDHPSAKHALQFRILMAHHAVFVGLPPSCKRKEYKQEKAE
jgi:hypothetical protein